MKRKILANVLLILILAACSTPNTSTATDSAPTSAATAAVQQQAAKVTPTTQVDYPAPATEPPAPAVEPTAEPTRVTTPTPYPGPEIPTQPPPPPLPDTTRYGVAKVDAVLDVLMSTDSESISPLLVYMSAPCTLKDGLGGPPKCVGEETEGTKVDVFPITGPEGSFLRQSRDNLIDMPGHYELLGVFSVKADFQSEQYYPAGKYCIVLHQKDTFTIVGLRVTDDGIVRFDFVNQMPDPATQPDLDAYLTPKS